MAPSTLYILLGLLGLGILVSLIWYLGPLNHITSLDFIGKTDDRNPVVFSMFSLLLVPLAILGRARQVRH